MTWHVLPENKKQALRMHRHFMADIAVFLFTVIGIYFYTIDNYIVSGTTITIALSTLWIGQLFFALAIRSGINRRFKDPSLTHAQIIWASLAVLLTSYALIEMRVLMLIGYLGIISFGFFRLKPKEFVLNALLTLSSYLFIITYIYINEPLRIHYNRELLQLTVFSVTCSILVYTGSAVSRLRDINRKRTEELKDAVSLNQLLAITDDLTGLYTRSHFMEILTQQKARVDREKNDFILLFCDLDHFKSINDSYGHSIGDAVIESFANIINISIREVDYASRYGGEEFVIALVNTDMENAKSVAERIRESIEQHNFNDVAPGLRVTASIGAASFQEFRSIQETLKVADDRMYKAKEAGRNLCVFES